LRGFPIITAKSGIFIWRGSHVSWYSQYQRRRQIIDETVDLPGRKLDYGLDAQNTTAAASSIADDAPAPAPAFTKRGKNLRWGRRCHFFAILQAALPKFAYAGAGSIPLWARSQIVGRVWKLCEDDNQQDTAQHTAQHKEVTKYANEFQSQFFFRSYPKLMESSLHQAWESAVGNPFVPTIGKGSQFFVGSTLLAIGLLLSGLFGLSKFLEPYTVDSKLMLYADRSLINIPLIGIPASVAVAYVKVSKYVCCTITDI
jgi:hypothetical protein